MHRFVRILRFLVQVMDCHSQEDFGARHIGINSLSYSLVAISTPLLADGFTENAASTTTNDSTTVDGSGTLAVTPSGTAYDLDTGLISETYYGGELGLNYLATSRVSAHLQLSWEI